MMLSAVTLFPQPDSPTRPPRSRPGEALYPRVKRRPVSSPPRRPRPDRERRPDFDLQPDRAVRHVARRKRAGPRAAIVRMVAARAVYRDLAALRVRPER